MGFKNKRCECKDRVLLSVLSVNNQIEFHLAVLKNCLVNHNLPFGTAITLNAKPVSIYLVKREPLIRGSKIKLKLSFEGSGLKMRLAHHFINPIANTNEFHGNAA